MASANSTERLKLSLWNEADYPERVDFNADRQGVDAAFGGLLDEAEAAAQGAAGAAAQAGQAQREMAGHRADNGAHIAAREVQEILSERFVSGGYEGTGAAERQVALGFEPRFAVIWCAGMPPVVENTTGSMLLYRDFCVPGVECAASETYSGGLYVFNASTAYNGFVMRLNESGRSYRYAAWA